MLEVVELILTEAEVKRMQVAVAQGVDVELSIKNITPDRTRSQAALEFVYNIDYQPKVAKVRVSGIAYCSDTPENIRKAASEFKKGGHAPLDLCGVAINAISSSVGLNTIFVLRPFNMLPPFMPPLLVNEEEIRTGVPVKSRKLRPKPVNQKSTL